MGCLGAVFGSQWCFEQGRSGGALTIGKLTQLYPGVGSGAPASALLLWLQGVHRGTGAWARVPASVSINKTTDGQR